MDVILLKIEQKIYNIRGKQVMLDKDLANFYELSPKRLNEQVKRNIKRFPESFMFQLNNNEYKSLRSQNATLNNPRGKHRKYLPYAFTEQGVSMLSGILRSDKAIEISIKIIEAFVEMRYFLAQNANFFQKFQQIDEKLISHDKQISKILDSIENKSIIPSKGIFYEGQIYDAHKFLLNLLSSSKKSIIIIDNYVDSTVLELFSDLDIDVIIYTKNKTKKLKIGLKEYNSQYKPILIKEFLKSHDRYLIIDEKELYHFGASLKDLGKKWFSFSKLDMVDDLLRKLN